MSLQHIRNPVDLNPETLDYHSDGNSVLGAQRMSNKIHLACLYLARDLET